jgi:hypothetical protein
MIYWVAAASIAAIVAAAAGVASAIIYWKTFKSVNDQTEISRKQFEMAMRRQEELSRPDLMVSVGNYIPSLDAAGNNTGTNGTLTVTMHNRSAISLREVNVTIVVANTKVPLLYSQGRLTISPGSSEDLRGPFFIAPQAVFVTADTICEFETPDGKKFQKCDRWNLYYSKDHPADHLDSSPVEEARKS